MGTFGVGKPKAAFRTAALFLRRSIMNQNTEEQLTGPEGHDSSADQTGAEQTEGEEGKGVPAAWASVPGPWDFTRSRESGRNPVFRALPDFPFSSRRRTSAIAHLS